MEVMNILNLGWSAEPPAQPWNQVDVHFRKFKFRSQPAFHYFVSTPAAYSTKSVAVWTQHPVCGPAKQRTDVAFRIARSYPNGLLASNIQHAKISVSPNLPRQE